MQTYREMAREVGMGEQYFEQLKIKNADLFQHMLKVGKGNLISGFHIYKDRVMTMRNALSDIYWYLKEERQLSKFSRFLHEEGFYRHPLSFVDLLPEAAFNSSSNLSFETYNKYLKILDIFKIYKGTRSHENKT